MMLQSSPGYGCRNSRHNIGTSDCLSLTNGTDGEKKTIATSRTPTMFVQSESFTKVHKEYYDPWQNNLYSFLTPFCVHATLLSHYSTSIHPVSISYKSVCAYDPFVSSERSSSRCVWMGPNRDDALTVCIPSQSQSVEISSKCRSCGDKASQPGLSIPTDTKNVHSSTPL